MLAIDCGNTRIKWARFDGARRTETDSALREGDDAGFARLAGTLDERVGRVLVANVAGAAAADRLTRVVSARLGTDPEFVGVRRKAYGIECGYHDPAALGVDRWLAMIAARRHFDGPLVVVAAGTAVTIDAVDTDGGHLGGLILPGDGLMIDALASRTAQIDKVPRAGDARAGIGVFGRSTAESVSHGARLAIAATVDRCVGLVTAALATPPGLVLTGGDAEPLSGWLASDATIRADLVLEGLAAIAETTEAGGA